jgi:acyl-CoA reductase-like NAD-dependent aldehyde dehydrogenase
LTGGHRLAARHHEHVLAQDEDQKVCQDVHYPFGGFRESGSPFKELGAPGLRFYTRIKTAAVRFSWS